VQEVQIPEFGYRTKSYACAQAAHHEGLQGMWNTAQGIFIVST